LANKRKLLLSSDAKTISRIFFAFFMSSKPGPLLKTAYVRTLWRGWISQLHEKLSKTLPEYPMFFSNDDAVFASELLLRNIADSLTRTPPPKVTAFDEKLPGVLSISGTRYWPSMLHMVEIGDKLMLKLTRAASGRFM
jgi:hypothetical protein